MIILYRTDIINNNVEVDNLTELLDRVESSGCYDKVGDAYYQLVEIIGRNTRWDVENEQLVLDFLDELEQRPATSKVIGYGGINE